MVGRLASALLIHHLQSIFLRNFNSRSQVTDVFIKTLVNDSVEELKKDIEELVADEGKRRSYIKLSETVKKQFKELMALNYANSVNFLEQVISEWRNKETNLQVKTGWNKIQQHFKNIEFGNGENANDLFNRLLSELEKIKINQLDAQTTLGIIAMIPPEDKSLQAKAIIYALGDPMISLIRRDNPESKWILRWIYGGSSSDAIPSYISSRNGIRGETIFIVFGYISWRFFNSIYRWG